MVREAGRALRLAAELRAEIGAFKQLLEKLQDTQEAQLPEFARTATVGKILQDFYTAAERLFEKIARETGEGIPNSLEWHKELLATMALDIPGVRPPVIDSGLGDHLDEYLRFRHVFRHVYGHELEWGEMAHLAEQMPETVSQCIHALERFCQFLIELAEQN